MKTSKIILAAGAALGLAATANADLVVDSSLGALADTTVNLTGDTSTSGNSNADSYTNAPNPAWDYSANEFVYEFSIGVASDISISQNTGGGTDHDHVLFNSLVQPAAATGIGFVDESGSFGTFGPGTYYLSVDGWNAGAGAYDFDLTITTDAPAEPPAATSAVQGKVFGNLAPATVDWYSFDHAGGTLAVSTSETRFIDGALRVDDTEIGIYDSDGNLVATNDDIDFPDNPYSQLTVDVAAGKYYIAVGEFNIIFGASDWDATSTGGAGSTGGEYSLRIVPTPGAMAVFGLAGLAGLRRRR